MRFFMAGIFLLLAGCDYEEVKTETGYKGKARVNPWLAAERFAKEKGYEVKSLPSWKNPGWEDSVVFMPAAILSNESFVRKMETWVTDGGHLVLLVDYAESERNDWRSVALWETRLEPAMVKFLKDARIDLKERGGKTEVASQIMLAGTKYEVSAESRAMVRFSTRKKSGVFVTREYGGGRISVLTDARIFRSRWIGEKEHAALLAALIEISPNEGAVNFIRGSGLSLWSLLSAHLWPVLIGLGLLLALWLWKSFARFGPVETAAIASPLRGYDHHLEALGDFQWRLDKGAALLAPLREQIVEAGQKLGAKAGRRDDDFFQLLADLAGIARERVVRALTEAAPSDSAVMTRTTADLQKLLKALK